MYYSTIAGMVGWSGGMVGLSLGQSIEDDHPLRLERPELFTDVEPGADIQTPRRVQTGVQRPGEVRSERRPVTPPTPTAPVLKAPPRNA